MGPEEVIGRAPGPWLSAFILSGKERGEHIRGGKKGKISEEKRCKMSIKE